MSDRARLLPHLIAARAESQPDRILIEDAEDGRSVSYAAFHETTLAWTAAFAQVGVEPGQNVVSMLSRTIDAYHCWLGLSWLGAIEVPINNGYRGRMLGYVISQSQTRCIVLSARFLPRLIEIADSLEPLPTVIVPDADDVPPSPFDVMTRRAFFRGASTPIRLQPPEPHDISCVVYTSGTTGPSKGVLIPWRQMYYAALSPPDDAIRDGDAYYAFWPPFHIGGKYALCLPTARNGHLVLRDRFSVSAFWDDVRRFGCSFTLLLAPLLRMLMSELPRSDDRDNPLRGAMVAPLVPEVASFCERFGVSVTTAFGMTEIGVPLATGWTRSASQACGRVRKGPPGYELRVVDERDETLPPGRMGELVVRTTEAWALNAGYYGMPEQTAAAWRNGWFHTGDGFIFDEQGDFYFVDRMKDCIRRRGENISSFEVEAHVLEHPEVTECAAIAVPSELGEDEVKIAAIRSPRSTLTPESLARFLIPRMPRFMVPRFIEFTEALPKTEATGRVQKGELRRDPLNARTWDREASGIPLTRD